MRAIASRQARFIPVLWLAATFAAAWAAGRAQQLLQRNNVTYRTDVEVEASAFLPGWLQPRRAAG